MTIHTWVSLVIFDLMGLIIFVVAAVGALPGSEAHASRGLKFMYNTFSILAAFCAGSLLATIALGFFYLVLA